jgi:CheY-like chemotaxis protein
MLMMVNDVLDFSKIEAGKLELDCKNVNLHTLLSQTELLFSRQFEEKCVKFIVKKTDEPDSFVITDDTRLNQVLNNLLSNALKFTKRGEVVLSAEIIEMISEFVTVRFSVKDTGIGITPDNIHRVFESFTQADSKTTRKFGGTGLGLSISKKITQALGGDLQVSSIPEKGSEFQFTIRFLRNPLLKPRTGEKKKATPFKSLDGVRLLIAEDNLINMKVACRFLQSWKVSVHKAVTGAEAVALCKNEVFDLLLLDLEMPEMDGYTALKEIRKMQRAIPAIAFTAAMFPDISNHLKNEGFNDYVMKPFRPGDLYNKIKQLAT